MAFCPSIRLNVRLSVPLDLDRSPNCRLTIRYFGQIGYKSAECIHSGEGCCGNCCGEGAGGGEGGGGEGRVSTGARRCHAQSVTTSPSPSLRLPLPPAATSVSVRGEGPQFDLDFCL